MHGLIADLVILNEEAGGYEQPLRERLERLIQSHSSTAAADRPGGIFLAQRGSDPGGRPDAAQGRGECGAGGGPRHIAPAIGRAGGGSRAARNPWPRNAVARDPSASLPFMELPYFNSLGGFTPDGREYAIYLGPDTNTPAPWVNVIANPTFGTLVSETGAGFTWYGNSQRNRLTQWSNDPVMDPPSEAIYIRDEETGVYWTPTASPIREETAYRARHGAGYTVFEHNSHGIEQELTVFVPVDENGGEPIKLQRLLLTNDSSRHRTLSVTYYVEWTLGENRESSQMHVVTHWDDEVQAMIARNRYHPEYGDRVAFAAISPPAESTPATARPSSGATARWATRRRWSGPGFHGGQGRAWTRAPHCRSRLTGSWRAALRSPACWARPSRWRRSRHWFWLTGKIWRSRRARRNQNVVG